MAKLSTEVTTKTGKKITLLTPVGKGRKYATELSNNCGMTNDFRVKCDATGYAPPLTSEQRSYRAGYLDAQRDSANCWNAKHGKKKRK